MRKITNPYQSIEGYQCFGCCPDNPMGLQMNFYEEGEEVCCRWTPRGYYQGYKDMLHGGIQATLMDELAGWTVSVKLGTNGVTYRLDVKYRKPVLVTGGDILLRARIMKVEKRIATLSVALYDRNNTLCSEGICEYYVLPEEKARKEFYYPGKEKFFSVD